MNPAIETKLRAARTRLCMDKPFLGALVVHLPFERADRCPSIATDARKLYFNPRYVERLSFAETQFVLAYAALHCALGHFARRGHRLRRRWDVACDHAINPLLVDEGLRPPAGVLLDARYRGLSAEEIYPLVSDDAHAQVLDLHAFDCMAGFESASTNSAAPARSTSDESDSAYHSDDEMWSDAGATAGRNGDRAMTEQPLASMQEVLQNWQARLAQAAQQAQLAGCLGASWQRVLSSLLAPRLPWRSLLARYLATLARDDYSFQRPSRREGQALLPRLHSGQIDVCVVLDTSGSIAETQLHAFVSEIDALKGQVRARVTVHACDHELSPQGPWIAETWQAIVLPERLTGGGGTDFRPVFDWIQRQGVRPDVLVYFTDAEGEFPPAAPAYPVLWLVKGRGTVPWGERIQLN